MSETIQKLTRDISAHYAHDVISPGVVVAWMAKRGTWYCSVRRYAVKAPEALRTHVVTAYESTDYDAALRGLTMNWRRILSAKQRKPWGLPKKPTVSSDGWLNEYDAARVGERDAEDWQ